MMKTAVASDNGMVTGHFGHCEGFIVFDNSQYHVEVIDTWNMTIADAGIHQGKFTIELPGREYMAIRIRKVE
jgi:predicted Fe-Mo cluster-binding NifX family protein